LSLIIVSIDGYEAAAGLVPESEECLYEIHYLGTNSLVMVIQINTKTTDLYGRVTPEMLLMRDLFPNLPKYFLFAIFTAYPVTEDTEEGYCLFLVLKTYVTASS
jgi:hypothetical protein